MEEELKEILMRYIPPMDDKNYYDSVVTLLTIRIMDWHERNGGKKE